jgi:hypothetical protein
MTQSNTEILAPSQDLSENIQAPETDQPTSIAHAIITWLTETAYHNLFEQPWHN